MKLSRFDYDPNSALAFFEESLAALGALCERTWHDRLEVLAERQAARLWNEEGTLHAQELFFAPADAKGTRDAGREVFPGCPLTFRLCEALRPAPLALEKVVLAESGVRAPDTALMEKLWRSQYPATRQWRLAGEVKSAYHTSLVVLARCEIQAIDQHWSLHRIAVGLPGGEADPSLAADISMLTVGAEDEAVRWPTPDPARWQALLRAVIELEIADDVKAMRARQEQYLQRELSRIDEYFASYEQELMRRSSRGVASNLKAEDRLAAAREEHNRRRLDQMARHEIRVRPHIDALLLVAERCWYAELEVEVQRTRQRICGAFVPRARRWFAG